MIICADDFGLREDVDRAILELCARRRLSAVSCLVLFERCSPESLRELKQFKDHIDTGLHLCLTDERLPWSAREGSGPLIFASFADCLKRSFRRNVDRGDVVQEIATQYELFKTKIGTEPAYVDGHLHIHQAPIVREALIEFVLGLPEDQRPYIRNTHQPANRLRQQGLPWVKSWVIGRFGSRMAARLRAAGLRTNEGFAGIYDFKKTRQFPKYFPCFIKCLNKPNGILVVHPGKNEEWRRREFETLRDADSLPEPNRFK